MRKFMQFSLKKNPKTVQWLLVTKGSLASHRTHAVLNIGKTRNLLMINQTVLDLKWQKQMKNFLFSDLRMESYSFQNKCSISCLSFLDEKMKRYCLNSLRKTENVSAVKKYSFSCHHPAIPSLISLALFHSPEIS